MFSRHLKHELPTSWFSSHFCKTLMRSADLHPDIDPYFAFKEYVDSMRHWNRINVQDQHGNTLLHLTATHPDPTYTEYLLKNYRVISEYESLNPEIENDLGMTAYDVVHALNLRTRETFWKYGIVGSNSTFSTLDHITACLRVAEFKSYASPSAVTPRRKPAVSAHASGTPKTPATVIRNPHAHFTAAAPSPPQTVVRNPPRIAATPSRSEIGGFSHAFHHPETDFSLQTPPRVRRDFSLSLTEDYIQTPTATNTSTISEDLRPSPIVVDTDGDRSTVYTLDTRHSSFASSDHDDSAIFDAPDLDTSFLDQHSQQPSPIPINWDLRAPATRNTSFSSEASHIVRMPDTADWPPRLYENYFEPELPNIWKEQ